MSHHDRWPVLAMVAVVMIAARADAYPQYQLGRESTCTGCHITPDGGGLLNENGFAVAESTAWKTDNSAFMYGMTKPDWLQLGGDARAAAGFVDPGTPSAAAYPMQAEVTASAESRGLSLHLTGGLRRPQDGGSLAHVVWSREHYAMWHSSPGANDGVYIRAGRFMPTFGLRLAEHVVYTQRFGGRPLYGEAYGLAVSYVTRAFEVHATGFLHDGLASAVEHGDGGAVYSEARLGDHAAIGIEAKYSKSDEVTTSIAGATGKLYLPGPQLTLLGEAEVIRREITVGAGDKATQLAAYAMASRPLDAGVLLDAGIGHFTQDTRVQGLYRDAVDVNLHWFMSSHIEWLLTLRLELLDAGSGINGGYALAQIHYRM